VLEGVLLVLLNDPRDLGMVDEGGQPEFGNFPDDLVSFVEEGSAQRVVLLFHLEDLLAGLLVHGVDLVLTGVDLLEGGLGVLVEVLFLYCVLYSRLFTGGCGGGGGGSCGGLVPARAIFSHFSGPLILEQNSSKY